MAKYTIDESYLTTYNAISKARNDVSFFVKEAGFKTIAVNDKKSHSKIRNIWYMIYIVIRLLFLNKRDIVFLQTSMSFLRQIQKIKSFRKFKIIYLIHDLYSLRFSEKESRIMNSIQIKSDMRVLSQCDYVIAHNNSMIDRIIENGCTANLVSLDIFDYLTHKPCKKREYPTDKKWEIAFAGNTKKSPFLNYIDDISHNYILHVYGGPVCDYKTLDYLGMVEPDELPSIIKGNFGLIWEGDNEIVKEDNYTCLNNPHKMSMYIVAGLPIIAWKESAAAKFVSSHNCGITISSLNEIDVALSGLSESRYKEMVNSCQELRKELIAGSHLINALQQCG